MPAGSATEARCSCCGAPFRCGFNDPDGCWCARLPPLPRAALQGEHGCLCEACLRAALRARAADAAAPN
ncbi:MAG: cysteine-rich CWC family protein [Burkholderiaceae bacterium]|nr:cysteine-rich CWC family protein [Burkholderiaceae bacterium]MCX7902446.1 cysteine-rich CWC family protein [Burkholderiaceae bacterium]